MNPVAHTDPPGEPPDDRALPWRMKDLERRMSAEEERTGREMAVRIQMSELLTGELGVIKAIESNSEAIRDLAGELAKDREDRARFLRQCAWAVVIGLALAAVAAVFSGAI